MTRTIEAGDNGTTSGNDATDTEPDARDQYEHATLESDIYGRKPWCLFPMERQE
jgi:hypothetical protein